MIRLINCAHVRVRDIHAAMAGFVDFANGVIATTSRLITSRFMSRGISNGDGLDFDGCTKVRVTNSKFNNGDDCVCLQTSLTEKPCKDVFVSELQLLSGRWAGIRIGLLSRGNFEDVTMTNCTFSDHNDSGLKIQMNEGGEMKNMVFTHLTMTNVPRPLFLTFCQKMRGWMRRWGRIAYGRR